jgi:hypothetical protein
MQSVKALHNTPAQLMFNSHLTKDPTNLWVFLDLLRIIIDLKRIPLLKNLKPKLEISLARVINQLILLPPSQNIKFKSTP